MRCSKINKNPSYADENQPMQVPYLGASREAVCPFSGNSGFEAG